MRGKEGRGSIDGTKFYAHHLTPLGMLSAKFSDTHLLSLRFTDYVAPANWSSELSRLLWLELDAYFHGELFNFSIPFKLPSQSEFYHSVYRALLSVKYGETISYEELARRAIKQNAGDLNNSKFLPIRAAASAMARNDIPIILPCHRVIYKNGKLGEYTGGSHIKQYLLNLEIRALRTSKKI